MTFLRWLGGFVVFFWLIGFLFKIGGGLINILLLAAAIVFIIDAVSTRKKTLWNNFLVTKKSLEAFQEIFLLYSFLKLP